MRQLAVGGSQTAKTLKGRWNNMQDPQSSEYIENEFRTFSLYTLSDRAIPAIADGLKPSGRRILYTLVLNNNTKSKTATVAGAAMRYHPHQTPEQAANSLAAFYKNNVPLLTGHGSFGTLLEPLSFGAPRYTSVEMSPFALDVLLADYDIVPMVPNYDDTTTEPEYFLPLVPLVLLNPAQGMAVGFASKIAPRDLNDIIQAQIAHLKNKPLDDVMPYFKPTDDRAVDRKPGKGKNNKWTFKGEAKPLSRTSVQISKLPYGISHTDLTDRLNAMMQDGKIIDYDDKSKDYVNIIVHFARGVLSSIKPENLLDELGLVSVFHENMNMLDFDGNTVRNLSFVETVREFTTWRLQWYIKRYERLLALTREDIQRYRDIILAIEKNVGSVARKISNKTELVDLLTAYGIVYTEYIAQLPVYRFTEDEKRKVQQKLTDALQKEQDYIELLESEDKRKQVYVAELTTIMKKYG